MSDIREQTPGRTGSAREGRGRGPGGPGTSWTGWVMFAAVLLVLLGIWHAIWGLVALAKDDWFLVSSDELTIAMSYDAWAWAHLLLGVLAVLTGVALMTGATWARVVTVAMVGVSALGNFASIGAYPVWSLVMLALDLMIIFAVTVHGAEIEYA